MSNVLIIGYGIVGHNLKRELSALRPDVYDKYRRDENSVLRERYDLAFVCVPAPYVDGVCDITEVRAAVTENNADLYIVKSAILPGMTEALRKETGKHIVYSPEYYGSTVHSKNYSFDFTILGGKRADCLKAVQILQACYDGRHRFCMTDSKTAELAKYMENAYLAMKVSFCCQFWEIAQKVGVDYSELRELFIMDPRVNPSHTFVFDEHPYWDSQCLNKDVSAIAETYNAGLLKSMVEYNRNSRNRTGEAVTQDGRKRE